MPNFFLSQTDYGNIRQNYTEDDYNKMCILLFHDCSMYTKNSL